MEVLASKTKDRIPDSAVTFSLENLPSRAYSMALLFIPCYEERHI